MYHPDIVESPRRSHLYSPPTSPLTKSPPAAMPKPPPVALTGAEPDESVNMMDFLTAPDMNDMSTLQQRNTYASHAATAGSRRMSTNFFDFVDMSGRKNITLMSNRESVYPVLMVTILFFVWGFAYGLLDTLNQRFQEVAHMSSGQTTGQHSAYYLGYILGPISFGRLVFKRWGFKACYTVGLCVYACGALIFWPSAVLTSFPAFLISNFITGLGLSTLEISANPFILLCGPPEYAEVRLNMSQAIQAIGSILSPLLAKKVLFKASANSLIDVQWTYLGIAFSTVLLAILYYYVPLPEATDEELEAASLRLPVPREATIGSSKVKVMWVTFGLGVFSQFCYVGGQESTSTSFQEFLARVLPSLDYVGHFATGHTAFMAARFIAAFLGIWMKPRHLLILSYAGAIAFAAACTNGHGAAPAAFIVLLMFFEGPIFSLIYGQALRGLGKHTKDGAVLLTAAIGGGAAFPPIAYAVIQAKNAQYAFCVIIAAYVAGILFPLYLNLYPTARQLCDPKRDEQTRRQSDLEEERRASMGMPEKKWKRFSLTHRKRKSKEEELPTVEHHERRSWPDGQSPVRNSSSSSSSSDPGPGRS